MNLVNLTFKTYFFPKICINLNSIARRESRGDPKPSIHIPIPPLRDTTAKTAGELTLSSVFIYSQPTSFITGPK